MEAIEQYHSEIHAQHERWLARPLLREVYYEFFRLIAAQLRRDVPGVLVEIGAGMGALKLLVPDCLCTDLVANPWIDRVEDAYALSFPNAAVSNLILFDVFHHLEFPGAALREFHRVLAPGGRLILFEPALSALGWVVYGLCHREPVAFRRPIIWTPPAGQAPRRQYAAQGNATRIFCGERFAPLLGDWQRVLTLRLAGISYVASGGYRGPQLYPTRLLSLFRALDRVCERAPVLFATRLLVVLAKP